MNSFWCPQVSLESTNRLYPTGTDCSKPSEAVYCEILNSDEVFAAATYRGKERATPIPVAQLRLTLEEFDADYFGWGPHYFASERLIEAMALDSSAARFFEVDASQSAPLPRSKNYRLMEVAVTEDVADPEKSDYEMRRPRPDLPLSPSHFRHYAFRPDAAPKHGLFYDSFFRSVFCTEAFALRVLKSGCTGMEFNDPNNPQQGRYFSRTLRGIEEYIDWDPVNGVSITEVVQAIN
jgi:hypothetical protein